MTGRRIVGFLLVALLALGSLASGTVRSIDFAQSLHGLWYWQGRLYTNDYLLGVTYYLSDEGSPVRTSLLPRGFCDVTIEGNIVYAISERVCEIFRYDMRRRIWLDPIPLPPVICRRLTSPSMMEIHGIEKVGGDFYLLAAPFLDRDSLVHRIVRWRTGSNAFDQYDCHTDFPELMGLQFYHGSLWTFQYETGVLWRVELGETSFQLDSSWHLTRLVTDPASVGFRGFLLGGDEIVLTSITYSPETETSRLHFVPYPIGFPREP